MSTKILHDETKEIKSNVTVSINILYIALKCQQKRQNAIRPKNACTTIILSVLLTVYYVGSA
jgi:hypothetical protein